MLPRPLPAQDLVIGMIVYIMMTGGDSPYRNLYHMSGVKEGGGWRGITLILNVNLQREASKTPGKSLNPSYTIKTEVEGCFLL